MQYFFSIDWRSVSMGRLLSHWHCRRHHYRHHNNLHAQMLAFALLLLLVPSRGAQRTSIVAGASPSRTEVEIMQRK